MSEPLPYSSDPADRGRAKLTERAAVRALVIIGISAALVSILLPLLNWLQRGQFERDARRCPTNLRQIGLAMQMYANDHGGQIPPTPDLLIDPTLDLLTPDRFVCPFTHDRPAGGKTAAQIRADLARPGHNSYVFTGLTGRFNDLTIDHVLAYDKPGNHTGANVLFGDGHTLWLDAQQTARLVAELNAGHNPPRPIPSGGRP